MGPRTEQQQQQQEEEEGKEISRLSFPESCKHQTILWFE